MQYYAYMFMRSCERRLQNSRSFGQIFQTPGLKKENVHIAVVSSALQPRLLLSGTDLNRYRRRKKNYVQPIDVFCMHITGSICNKRLCESNILTQIGDVKCVYVNVYTIINIIIIVSLPLFSEDSLLFNGGLKLATLGSLGFHS